MSIRGGDDGARGVETAHVLSEEDGTPRGEGDTTDGQSGRYATWVAT